MCSDSYLAVWLVFAWIIVPLIVGALEWRRERRMIPPKWLIPSSKALLALDASGSLVPHGIGENARAIITEFLILHGENPNA